MKPKMARLLRVMRKVLGRADVGESAELGKTPGWDSLRHVSLLAAVEKEFGVKFGRPNVPRLTSAKKIAAFLGCS